MERKPLPDIRAAEHYSERASYQLLVEYWAELIKKMWLHGDIYKDANGAIKIKTEQGEKTVCVNKGVK